MVNPLVIIKIPAENLFHYQYVLKHVPTINGTWMVGHPYANVTIL